jgi:hypothetical protein
MFFLTIRKKGRLDKKSPIIGEMIIIILIYDEPLRADPHAVVMWGAGERSLQLPDLGIH